jgi:hypothetical protein
MLPKHPSEIPRRWVSLSPKWQARTQHWAEPQWQLWRRTRVARVVRLHKVLSQRELEARVSDFVKPGTPVVEPHHITNIKDELHFIEASTEPVPFYTRRKMRKDLYLPVLQEKQALYHDFLDIATQDTCGSVAERVVLESLRAASNLALKPHKLGNVKEINGRTTQGSLDSYAYVTLSGQGLARQAVPIGIEVKNIREWVYPESSELWQALRAAVELECVPILVTRRIHITTGRFCKSIGMLTHETQKQYFARSLEGDSRLLAAHERLHFRDVIPWEEADPSVTRFFEVTLPTVLDRTLQNFAKFAHLIRTYAIDGDLHNDDLHLDERTKRFAGFRQEYIALTGETSPGW